MKIPPDGKRLRAPKNATKQQHPDLIAVPDFVIKLLLNQPFGGSAPAEAPRAVAKGQRRQFLITAITEAYIYAEDEDDAYKQADALGRCEKIESVRPPCTVLKACEMPPGVYMPGKKAGK